MIGIVVLGLIFFNLRIVELLFIMVIVFFLVVNLYVSFIFFVIVDDIDVIFGV